MGLSLRPVSSRLSRAFSTRTTVVEIPVTSESNTGTRTSTAILETPGPNHSIRISTVPEIVKAIPESSAVSISKPLPKPPSCPPPRKPSAPRRRPPIYTLPLEIFQLVASYLDNQSAAAFCLSSRYICYAIGRRSLAAYLKAPPTTHEKRRNIEILERAFPSAWYCSWCDKFHQVNKTQHPRGYTDLKIKGCGIANGYLHDGDDYIIAHHHVRLAVHRVQWGPEYGIRLNQFDFDKQSEIKVLKAKLPTQLKCEANIVDGKFYLHATYSVTLPQSLALEKRAFKQLFLEIPQIIRGHVCSKWGHGALERTFHASLLSGKQFLTTEQCSDCATDFVVTYNETPTSNPKDPLVTMGIEVWRDLGNGRSPFDTAWRAHIEIGNCKPGKGSNRFRVTSTPAGHIRTAFERGADIGYATPAETGFVSKCEVPSQTDLSLLPIWTQEIIRARSDREEFNAELDIMSRRRSPRYSG